MSIKSQHRALFLAMQADAKGFPGGISAVAEYLGRNGSTVGNQLNPDHDATPPSLELLVDLIKLTGGQRTAYALAQLAGQITVDVEFRRVSHEESVQMFVALVQEAGAAMAKGAEFAADLRFDSSERRALEPLLLKLLTATVELIHANRD